MRILTAALLYFLLVFACGFVLGTIRTLWLLPLLGERLAVLCELPLMVAISIAAARWVAHRMRVRPAGTPRLAMGALALLLLLSVEFGVVLRMRGLSIDAYLAERDPVAGAAYSLSLLLFALAPWLVARMARDPPRHAANPLR